MKALTWISDKIAKISSLVSAVLIASVALVLFTQVILRFIFNSGISWAPEYATVTTIWAVMLIANVLVKEDELISADFFDSFWSKKFIAYRNALYQIIFFVLLIILIKEGWEQATISWNITTPSMQISWFYPYLAIPVGSLFILYQYVYKTIKIFRKED